MPRLYFQNFLYRDRETKEVEMQKYQFNFHQENFEDHGIESKFLATHGALLWNWNGIIRIRPGGDKQRSAGLPMIY